jgi:hypothetical protein
LGIPNEVRVRNGVKVQSQIDVTLSSMVRVVNATDHLVKLFIAAQVVESILVRYLPQSDSERYRQLLFECLELQTGGLRQYRSLRIQPEAVRVSQPHQAALGYWVWFNPTQETLEIFEFLCHLGA